MPGLQPSLRRLFLHPARGTVSDTTHNTHFPSQQFLPLASVSNVGKAMALAAFVATAPAFQQALCTGGNIADVTAKGQVRMLNVYVDS